MYVIVSVADSLCTKKGDLGKFSAAPLGKGATYNDFTKAARPPLLDLEITAVETTSLYYSYRDI